MRTPIVKWHRDTKVAYRHPSSSDDMNSTIGLTGLSLRIKIL
ncbi:hypothetical protein X971_3006 [Agrobacterium tumefaciens LBA4213 (Ach5)]|nr:hypothetical protein X971_3006 [Agrobacterium tumefaciens LBA4213 (Ach5)]